MLGGSSALNGLAFSATSKTNVDAWESLGNPGWGWSDYYESTKKSYTLPLQGAGANGPLQLSTPEEDTEWPRSWRETLTALGFSVAGNPFTGQSSGGLTVADSIHPVTKQRSYAGNAYLQPARSRDNLTIWTSTLAEKVTFDQSNGTVATGVQVVKDGESKFVAAHEVIVAAGTINSPQLLELSGVGDAKLLQSLRINVVIDNPHVGENLQNHPMTTMSFEVRDQSGFATMDKIARQDPSAIAAAMEAYSKQKGPLSRSGTNSAAQLPLPGIETKDGQRKLHELLQSVGLGTSENPNSFMKAYESFVRSVLLSSTEASGCYTAFPGFAGANSDGSMAGPPPGQENYFTIILLLAHPLSRGSVHINSKSTSPSAVTIDPKYFTHPLDLEVLARHLQFVETIASTEPLATHLKLDGKRSPLAPPAGELADLVKAKEYIRKTAVGAHHFTGTCSMMPKELGGVVDAQLRVYGCRNLRVCDASIIPLTPRTNPQATVYGVAEHAAHIIMSGRRD